MFSQQSVLHGLSAAGKGADEPALVHLGIILQSAVKDGDGQTIRRIAIHSVAARR